MAGGEVVAICQFGGEFVSNSDGSMSYTGGEAHAIDIGRDMLFNDFKSEIASLFDIDTGIVYIKYFLPNNKRTLITLSSDRDLQRMIDFHASSMTVDVYILNRVENRTSTVANTATNNNARQQKRAAVNMVSGRGKNVCRVTRSRTRLADSVAAEVPTIAVTENVRPSGLTVAEMVDHRATGNAAADSSLPIAASVAAFDNAIIPNSPTPQHDIILGLGQEFDNVKDFRDKLFQYAIRKGFAYKFIKNEVARVTAKCIVENCPWRLHASRSSCKQKLTIKKLNNEHTCEGGTGGDMHPKTTKKWLVDIIKDKLRSSPQYKPREILHDIYEDYGINLNYSQVWRGKMDAQKELLNLHEEAFNQLPRFCERILETNPGSVVTLTASDDLKFRIFVSFHACIHGFENGCRPLLFLDRIPLKENNHLKLLAAAAVDGDDGVFPVAFAAVEAETNESWFWFLEQLKNVMTTSRTITFVSNRQNGLEEAVPKVFVDSYHSFCLVHLVEDFKAELNKGPWSQEVKDAIVGEFERAALTCRTEDFNARVECIKNISKDAAEWIMANKPEHWSNALFRGSRYDHLSCNVVESFSTWIPVNQESSVVLMIDAMHSKIMEVIHARRESSDKWEGILTPSMEKKLQKEISKAQKLNVFRSSDMVFEVRGGTINVVNIGNWECTCRRWQISGLPCLHAIAVFDQLGRSVYDYSSHYFRSECYRLTYTESVHPIPDVEQISSSFGAIIPTPRNRRPSGILKQTRLRLQDGNTRGHHCSRCRGSGHNKTTCEALV